jgi:histidine kinase
MWTVLQNRVRQRLTGGFLLASLAAIAAASVASWWITGRIVGPVRAMAHVSQRIAAGHYNERLPASTERDELGELTRSFNRMAEALEETEALRQQLIADSHELKTPLASIKGYMEGLQDAVIAPTPQTFDLVRQEADRLQRLVLDMQMLSRAEAHQLNIEPARIDAIALARSALEWLQPQFEGKGVLLEQDLGSGPLTVLADYDRIRQVLLNVAGNALQYTPAGGSVTVSLRREDGMAHFSVRDTGAGLAPGSLEAIFERFYRVDKSRARASGGSGLGLTIARYIVTEHGGRIWAESDGPGRGSTFHFTLPLA